MIQAFLISTWEENHRYDHLLTRKERQAVEEGKAPYQEIVEEAIRRKNDRLNKDERQKEGSLYHNSKIWEGTPESVLGVR